MRLDIKQLEFINPILRSIVVDIEEHFGIDFTCTSLYRINDKGVHGTLPLRGIDLRCRSLGLGEVISKYINNKWIYDYKRGNKVCCLIHNAGSGLHLHIQVHFNTRHIYESGKARSKADER